MFVPLGIFQLSRDLLVEEINVQSWINVPFAPLLERFAAPQQDVQDILVLTHVHWGVPSGAGPKFGHHARLRRPLAIVQLAPAAWCNGAAVS